MARSKFRSRSTANCEVISLQERNKIPEQILWISVLAKAFEDAFRSSNERAALDALSWIKNGSDFGLVCHYAGRDPRYVKSRMLDKVIEREAQIIGKREYIKRSVQKVLDNKVVVFKKSLPKKIKQKTFYVPKYTHDYIDRNQTKDL
tara:strand:+ start:24 stop:464 length:441 start_codon:yes stop_codon:yes gene_type:complete